MENAPGAGDARPLAILALRSGPAAGRELPLARPVVNVGRGPQSDVSIDDDSVSTTHAEIEYEGGTWRITDLGSTNGTFVEGVRLAPQVPTPLPYGSTVRFGGVQTHFRPVPGADLEAARAAHPPEPARRRVSERRSGFRLPLWVVLVFLVVAVLAVAWLGAVGWPEPAAEPAPEPTPALLLPAPPDA